MSKTYPGRGKGRRPNKSAAKTKSPLDTEQECPSVKRPALNSNKKALTFNDLKAFAKNAVDSQTVLSRYDERVDEAKRSKTAKPEADDDCDEIGVEDGKRLAKQTLFLYTSTVKGAYPGEKILFTNEVTPQLVEGLYTRLAFASSTEELIDAKCALRQAVTSSQWRPKIEHFLGILRAGFGADIDRLLPMRGADSLKEKASINSEILSGVQGKTYEPALRNLDALLEVLSWTDWDDTSDEDTFAWAQLLLALSLDVQCRTRFAFQSSIQNCLRRMSLPKKTESSWLSYCKSIQSAIIGDQFMYRHHYDMVHLCSLLPVSEAYGVELRTCAGFGCIAVQMGDDGPPPLPFSDTVVSGLVEILEKGRDAKAGAFRDAYSLSGLLELVQLTLSSTAIGSSSQSGLDRLTAIVQSLISKRLQSDEDPVGGIHMSITDRMYIHCIVNVVVDKMKLYAKSKPGRVLLFEKKENRCPQEDETTAVRSDGGDRITTDTDHGDRDRLAHGDQNRGSQKSEFDWSESE